MKTKGATLHFRDLTREQADKIRAAQVLLREAGVSFDSGFATDLKQIDWYLDWSLQGPVVLRIKEQNSDEEK